MLLFTNIHGRLHIAWIVNGLSSLKPGLSIQIKLKIVLNGKMDISKIISSVLILNFVYIEIVLIIL